tara:strand:- start:128 stop:646 length:519 start_codon:yes stop_codon:yes gene_type:complete
MTLINKEAKRVYGLTTFVGGTMGTAGYKQSAGWAYVFSVDGYKIIKNVFNGGFESYQISGKNITEFISMDVLSMSEVDIINEKLRVDLLSDIMISDLTRVKNIMTTNKDGFTFFMKGLIGKGLSKDIAFANVVKDYYSDKFYFTIDTNSIIKVMVKYGYEFTTMADANKLIR